MTSLDKTALEAAAGDVAGEPVAYMHPISAIWRADNYPAGMDFTAGGWVPLVPAARLLALSAENARLTRELADAATFKRWVSDHVRPLIPSDQNPAQADDPFGVIGFMVLQQARAEAAEARVKVLVAAGAPLANLAYNLAQGADLPEATRNLLNDARIAWDAARTLSKESSNG